MLLTVKANNQETTYKYMDNVEFGIEEGNKFTLNVEGLDSKLETPNTEIWFNKDDSFKIETQPGHDDGNIAFTIYVPYKNSHITVEKEIVSAEFTADEVTVTMADGTTETFKNEDSFLFEN